MNRSKNRHDVEKYIISCLTHDDCYKIIKEKEVSPAYFSPGSLRELYRLSIEYRDAYDAPLTPEVLLEEISHLSYNKETVASLHATFKDAVSEDVDANNVAYYCDTLRDFLAGDVLKSSFQKAIDVTKGDGSKKNLKALEELQSNIAKHRSLLEADTVVKVYDIEDMEVILKERMIERKLSPEKFRGIKTGIKEVDVAFGAGLNAGELTLFMAEPGGGKTTTMLSVANAIWRNSKKNVVYFTLEMEAAQIALKHLSADAVTSFDRLESADLTATNKKSVQRAFEERKKLSRDAKFKYVDMASSGKIKASVLEAAIKDLIPYMKIDVIVVDYLGLLKYDLDCGSDSTEQWAQAGDVCKFLRGIGKKYGFSTISAVQLKRDAISRIRKKKDSEIDFGADDAAESNQISADADRIFALMIDKKNTRYIRMFTAKNRYGRKNYECSLYFDPECSRVYGDKTTYNHDELFNDREFDDIVDQAQKTKEAIQEDLNAGSDDDFDLGFLDDDNDEIEDADVVDDDFEL
jgi:replicative DNA helicase